MEKVVVTGQGAVTPLGLTVEETWQNLINGVSGVAPFSLFDASDLLVKVGCEVKGFKPEEYMPARETRRRDRFEQFAAAVAGQALQQAGLKVDESNAGRIGVVVSSAIGGVKTFEENVRDFLEEGPRRVSPFFVPMLMANGGSGLISIDHGFKGPSFAVVSACASGADGIGMAWLMLRAGLIDAAIAGASEAPVTAVGVAAFDRMGAMSRRDGDHPRTPQPFDLNRDGLVIGEGAAVLVLERESHARARRADILAELAGYAASADSFHITAPAEDGSGGALAMRLALLAAGVNYDEVGYINAHGTGTPMNDLSETRALKATFGEQAYHIPVSSTKSMTGHMMGATGAVEAVFCIQAIRHGILPPTINYDTPDPECDLDYIPNQAREKPINVAISNAFGFGGHNAVLVFREYN
jgi:beta-ketoacyl-acyl-carrier-protein synthase II